MKRNLINTTLLALASFSPLFVFGQEETEAAVEAAPLDFSPNTFEWTVALVALLVIVAAIITIFKIMELLVRMREIEIYEKHGLEKFLEEKRLNEGSWWNKFSRTMTGAVPVSQEADIMLDHNYDGIRELDNNLPPWWLYGFYVTIGFSVFYIIFFHFSPYAKSSTERYEIQMAKAQEEVDAYLAKQADQVDENNVYQLTDADALTNGQEIFTSQCAACHLNHGGGSPVSVGPNLTDEYWLHGGSISDVFKTIKYGVPEKGMISWKTQLRPADMHAVASYILTLQGTNPENAKEPQGELYVPVAEATDTESTDEALNESE
ncbi:MAG: c-type cytochrome [Saprospiraceae bacterium]|nr:c-type cytochrome [Saprospiraceae bacterium]